MFSWSSQQFCVCVCACLLLLPPTQHLKEKRESLGIPLPPFSSLSLFLSCQGRKAAVKKGEEKPNNQVSPDKQLVSVLSSASTQESLP